VAGKIYWDIFVESHSLNELRQVLKAARECSPGHSDVTVSQP
jgi:hypothetical protein